MRCDYCGEQDATVHLGQLLNGEMKNLHLCKECAGKSGINVDDPVSLSDLLLKAGLASGAPEAGTAEDTSCPECHMRLSDFRKTSRLGCPACYEAFAAELAGLLLGLHKSQYHAGKAPSGTRLSHDIQVQAEGISRRLKAAIATEQFEEAARLRDELKQLQGELREDAVHEGS
jgi:protein arginine kinase activator